MDANRGNQDIFILIVALFVLAAATMIYAVCSYHMEATINNIIDNPAFMGTVVGKETITGRTTMMGAEFPVHRLHIVGEYFDGSERIEVDRVFTVTAAVYNRFEIGDIINVGGGVLDTPICSYKQISGGRGCPTPL